MVQQMAEKCCSAMLEDSLDTCPSQGARESWHWEGSHRRHAVTKLPCGVGWRSGEASGCG